jgi:hypothetical protein
VLVVAEHRRDRRDRLLLHRGGGRAAVQSVVVRVEQHRRGVGGPGQRMGRLEHLADVVRFAVGVGAGEALGEALQRRGLLGREHHDVARERAERRERRGAPRQPLREFRVQANVVGTHHQRAREIVSAPMRSFWPMRASRGGLGGRSGPGGAPARRGRSSRRSARSQRAAQLRPLATALSHVAACGSAACASVRRGGTDRGVRTPAAVRRGRPPHGGDRQARAPWTSNCCSSVEPGSAIVEALPPVTVSRT